MLLRNLVLQYQTCSPTANYLRYGDHDLYFQQLYRLTCSPSHGVYVDDGSGDFARSLYRYLMALDYAPDE